jgi:hypothetical protein
MARSSRPPRTIKATLTRFAIAAIVFVGLTIRCVLTVDRDLRVLVGILAFAAFLVSLLFGMDAGKAINREPTQKRSLRVVGAILIFPLAIFGAIFIAAGLVGVFVSIRALEMEVCTGKFSIETFEAIMRLVVCFFLPLAGYAMLREGLRRDPAVTQVIQHGSKKISVLSVPLWFRLLIFTQGIAVGTLVLAFAVAAAATNDCRAAAWIWSPIVSISVVIVAAAIAAGIFALRRRRVAQKIR